MGAIEVDHLDVAPTRSLMTSLSKILPTANHWPNIDPSFAVAVPQAPNQLRSNTGHVLLPDNERMVGRCGALYGMMHEFTHSIKDDNYLATLVLSSQPNKYGSFDSNRVQRCQEAN